MDVAYNIYYYSYNIQNIKKLTCSANVKSGMRRPRDPIYTTTLIAELSVWTTWNAYVQNYNLNIIWLALMASIITNIKVC